MLRRARIRARRQLRGDRGEVIPTAILWPLAIFSVLIGVQVMFIHKAKDEARAAAQQAATAEAAYQAPSGTAAATASNFLAADSQLILDQNVVVNRSATDVRVTVSGTVVGWLGLRFNISQTGYASIERFTTEATP